MIDVTLSILALIAGGFVLELFAAVRPPHELETPCTPADHELFAGLEESQCENPS